jgi:DNA-binding response OmpR family regulator
MRILIVEDDSTIRSALTRILRNASFAVDTAKDGEIGSLLARTHNYDLIILDYFLPKKNGGQLCKEIREAKKQMPILILSVQNSPQQRATLLNEGADDYMVKPFLCSEFMARIHALLRRPPSLVPNILTLGPITIDLHRHSATIPNYVSPKKNFLCLNILHETKDCSFLAKHFLSMCGIWNVISFLIPSIPTWLT